MNEYFEYMTGYAIQMGGLSIRNGLTVCSEEQAKTVPIYFPTNEIARSKICSVDLMNGHLLYFFSFGYCVVCSSSIYRF
jgi:hypothetical protein